MLKKVSLSVIICTYNRSDYLRKVLESLKSQTLTQDKFEIVIIDDGSSDGTRDVAGEFSASLPIRYFYQRNAGLASAKNHGIYASLGGLLFFLDDDDIATPNLLEEHLKAHQEYPAENYAVLHYTAWAPSLTVTPLMHFITEVGCFLFSYPYIKHGDILDYTNFWGGRTSCKRSFLIRHGVFNPVFRFGCEDIELGYRLSVHGLKVVYNSRAVALMIRPVGLDDFCKRLIKQGRSQYVFSMLHDDPGVRNWAEVSGSEDKWSRIKPVFPAKLRSCIKMDELANMKIREKLGLDALTEKLLYNSYWWIFKACKIKGISEAMEESRRGNSPQTPAADNRICVSG